jgi:hypothetical protein
VFEPVTLKEQGRVGLLTSAALVASWSGEENTAPMTRGKLLLNRVLCQDLPDPPPDLEIPAVPEQVNATTRERFAIHGQNPGCAGCHGTLDAVAFALSHFDAVGRYQSEEQGRPIDATGSISGTDVDGAFANMTELAARLSGSRHARLCLAREYVRFASATGQLADSECVHAKLVDAAASGSDTFAELAGAFLASDYFLTRGPQR